MILYILTAVILANYPIETSHVAHLNASRRVEGLSLQTPGQLKRAQKAGDVHENQEQTMGEYKVVLVEGHGGEVLRQAAVPLLANKRKQGRVGTWLCVSKR